MLRRILVGASAAALAAVALTACGSATYTGQDGTCHALSVQSTKDADGNTIYNGVKDAPCPAPPTTTVTAPPVTTTVTASQPPSSSAAPSSTATPPPAAGFPTAATTGYAAGSTLEVVANSGADYYSQGPGTTIENVHVKGDLYIDDDNVTVKNSWVEGQVKQSNNSYHYALDHVTVGPESGCNGNDAVGEKNYTATAVKIQHFGDGFRSTDKVDATTAGTGNIAIKDSLVVLCASPGDHSDGFQGYYGGSNVLIEHNTIDQGQASKDVPTGVTAPVFNSDYSKGLTLTNNLLIGGSFTIRLGSDGKNTAESKSMATGNLVVKDAWVYGPVSSDCAQIDWSGNKIVTLKPGTYEPTDAGTDLACTS